MWYKLQYRQVHSQTYEGSRQSCKEEAQSSCCLLRITVAIKQPHVSYEDYYINDRCLCRYVQDNNTMNYGSNVGNFLQMQN